MPVKRDLGLSDEQDRTYSKVSVLFRGSYPDGCAGGLSFTDSTVNIEFRWYLRAQPLPHTHCIPLTILTVLLGLNLYGNKKCRKGYLLNKTTKKICVNCQKKEIHI